MIVTTEQKKKQDANRILLFYFAPPQYKKLFVDKINEIYYLADENICTLLTSAPNIFCTISRLSLVLKILFIPFENF